MDFSTRACVVLLLSLVLVSAASGNRTGSGSCTTCACKCEDPNIGFHTPMRDNPSKMTPSIMPMEKCDTCLCRCLLSRARNAVIKLMEQGGADESDMCFTCASNPASDLIPDSDMDPTDVVPPPQMPVAAPEIPSTMAPATTTEMATPPAPTDAMPSSRGVCVACARKNFDMVNAYRVQMGRPALKWDERLGLMAAEWSMQMMKDKRMYHSDYKGVWENVAHSWNPSSGFEPTGEKFFDMWKKSTGHNRNMFESQVTCCGVGIAGDPGSGEMYGTQVFSSSC